MSKQNQPFGLSHEEVQIVLQLSTVIAGRLQKEAYWSPLKGDLSESEILEQAFAGVEYTYYTYFEQKYVNQEIGEIRESEQIIKYYENDLSTLSYLEKSLVRALSQPIVYLIVRNAHERICLSDSNDFMRIISNSLIDKDTNSGWELDNASVGRFIRFVALDVVLMLNYYVEENKEGKKRGKYRKKNDLPHPDLPSNHYLNLQSVSLGIRAAPDLKAAIDAAVARSPLNQSRNEWVKSAIKEKLLRENPDLLADPSPGGD